MVDSEALAGQDSDWYAASPELRLPELEGFGWTQTRKAYFRLGHSRHTSDSDTAGTPHCSQTLPKRRRVSAPSGLVKVRLADSTQREREGGREGERERERAHGVRVHIAWLVDSTQRVHVVMVHAV
jgi:hypothetical protein